MNKLALALALSATALAACSTASGPTFSASELQPRDGVRTFQVDCHGLLSGPQTCMKAARKICGEEPVRAVDSAARCATNPIPRRSCSSAARRRPKQRRPPRRRLPSSNR